MSSDTDIDSESTDSESTESRETGTHDRSPLTWLVAAAAIVLIAGVGIFGFLNRGAGEPDVPSVQDTPSQTNEPTGPGDPTVTVLSAPSAQAGRCLVPNADTLSRSPLAFDGTVENVTDGDITLSAATFYAGAQTDLVRVESSPEALAALIGAVDFQVGQRYLVSASGGQVTVCGLSGPFSPELEALYLEAFSS